MAIRFMNFFFSIYVFLVIKSSTSLSLELIIQRASKLHNDMFTNKLVNMRLNLTRHIILYFYMYNFLKIYLYKLEIELYKSVNRLIWYQIIIF